jgi:GH15 family glucan-1,4-alpha-glucosidase
MPRDLPISNGGLYVNFDEKYNIRDVFYPQVGLADHTKGHAWRFGFHVSDPDGSNAKFAWTDDDRFERQLNYLPDTLVTNVNLLGQDLGLKVTCNDFIHYRLNAYLKKVVVQNLYNAPRVLKTFLHIDPYLKESRDANSVLLLPNKALVAYKDDVWLMANAAVGNSTGFDAWACGHKDDSGERGTFHDATDGKLGMGKQAQGSVDCVGAVQVNLEPNGTAELWFWIVFGNSKQEVDALNHLLVPVLRPGNLVFNTCKNSQDVAAKTKNVLENILGLCSDNVVKEDIHQHLDSVDNLLKSLDRLVGNSSQVNLSRRMRRLMLATELYWRYWVTKQARTERSSETCTFNLNFKNNADCKANMADLGDAVTRLYRRSLLMVRAHSDAHGGIVAANDLSMLAYSRDTYSYVWLRDAVLCAYSLDIAGYGETPRNCYKFARSTIVVEDAPDGLEENRIGYWYHKYNLNGSFASSWHAWVDDDGNAIYPIQEDETALPVVGLWKHYEKHSCTEFIFEGKDNLYNTLVVPAANFLASFRNQHTGLPASSHDLWEERNGIHAWTVASVYAGLLAAVNFGKVNGDDNVERWQRAADEIKEAFLKYFWVETDQVKRFVRMINVDKKGNVSHEHGFTVDASMFAIWYFGLLPATDPRVVATMTDIENHLWVKTNVGGIARYYNDYYCQVEKGDLSRVPGNPWIICTLWLAQWHIARAKNMVDLRQAKDLINWTVKQATPSGLLPEQLHPYTGQFLSVSPLTWSHATFVLTVAEYSAKHHELLHGNNTEAAS